VGSGFGQELRQIVPAVAMALVTAVAVPAAAQQGAPEIGARLMRDPGVRRALDIVRAQEPRLLEDQVRICEVPAPPFAEAARAELYRSLLEEAGLKDARIDRAGNVIAERPGRARYPHVVLSAHLDTVFPEATDVRVTRQGTLFKGPGIGDDCRGLAVVLGVARALQEAALTTSGPITFVGTVGEEGLGDLRGVKHLFAEEMKGRIDRFVSVDGTGYGITHIGVGSLRYRVTFRGPGGHSYGSFGAANPVHALGRAIARIGDFQVPARPKTTFNVGRVGGGTSVNSIAFDAWMEVDLRAAAASELLALKTAFIAAVQAALEEENARWGHRGRLDMVLELVGDRPAGRVEESAPIVQAALSVTRSLGLPTALHEGSTDANAPMDLGVPAITIDGGGRGTAAHSLNETFETTDSWKGTQRALLLALALAEP
jgi:acetylornithine deacetylase/succinyl-diaminopimelate desuccinylase-like protein